MERSWKKTFRVRRLKNLSACLETLLASSHSSSWSAGWSVNMIVVSMDFQHFVL